MTAARLALLALLLLPSLLRAQVPDTARHPAPAARDTARGDTTTRRRADSLGADATRADSLRTDSLRAARRDSTRVAAAYDPTARYLAGERLRLTKVPVLPRAGDDGPRPPLARIVLTADSIEWNGAETVSDLLTRVPGVFVWRAGWVGRAEVPTYQARGSTAVEYWLDGIPYLPLGADSVAVDASLFSLRFLERVEIERWPGMLRVRLYTREHDRLAARSELGIATGSGQFTRYQATLEHRSRSGVGATIAADYLNSGLNGAADAYRNTQLWAQMSLVRSPRFGMSAQLFRSRPLRQGIDDAIGGVLEPGFHGTRSELQLRGSFHPHATTETATRGVALGPSLDLLLARSAWDDSLLSQHVYSAGAIGAYRAREASATLTAFYRSRWTPADLMVQLGWTPVTALGLWTEGRYQQHDGSRRSRSAGVHAALTLPYGFVIGGAGRIGRIVSAPAIASDTAQPIADGQVTFSFERRRLGFEVGYGSNDGFQPQAFPQFGAVPIIPAQPRLGWLSAAGHLSPLPWLTFESWFTTPRPLRTAQGQPPALAITRGTIHSKFLRVFPSGIFDLKLQLSVEHWSDGVLGTDLSGAPVRTPYTNFVSSLVEVRLGGLALYWEQRNLTAGAKSYVPGYPIPRYARALGARWQFSN